MVTNMNETSLTHRRKLTGARVIALFAAASFLPLVAEAKRTRPEAPEEVATIAKPAPAPVVHQALAPQGPADVAAAAAKIDAVVLTGVTKAGLQMNAPATDEQIVRRLYLDIAGRIPTAEEIAAFLADKSTDKRAKLIDRLLASDGYNSNMFNYLSDMFRVADDYGKGAKTFVYEEWLKDEIAANRTWDVLVREMLTASGKLTNSGPVGYLLRDRGMPLDSLSNTLTIFLGANVACAQCHDHPLAQWKQQDFFEMASFFGATDAGYKKKGKGNVNLKALVAAGVGKGEALRVTVVNAADVETLHSNSMTYPKDYKYNNAKPGSPVKPVLMTWSAEDLKNPAYTVDTSSPQMLREQFANWITHPQNPRFATAIANRLWKRFFGVAVQEPITDLDNLAKASNPALLEELTAQMKRVKFDLKEFQRIVLNTQTYQRQVSSTPDPAKGPYVFPGPLLRRMTAEQTWDSVLTLVVGPDLDHFKLHRAEEITQLDIPGKLTVDNVVAKVKEIKEKEGKHKKHGKKAKGYGAGVDVTADEFEGNPPPKFEDLTLARASELAQPTKEAHFLRMFGQSDRQLADDGSTEGGVPQVMMLMNGHVQKCIASSASQVLKHAAAQSTPQLQVKSLYLSFLGRPPTDHEMTIATGALAKGLTLGDLTWVLFNTREFIFVQ